MQALCYYNSTEERMQMFTGEYSQKIGSRAGKGESKQGGVFRLHSVQYYLLCAQCHPLFEKKAVMK